MDLCYVCVFFFFFQAEDGIRDYKVTGVQTCALPISTSPPQAVTLSNTGSGTLTISSIAISGGNSGDFAQTNNCGGSVAAGARCTISVTFTPAGILVRSSTLVIQDNASGSPQEVSLTGTGL